MGIDFLPDLGVLLQMVVLLALVWTSLLAAMLVLLASAPQFAAGVRARLAGSPERNFLLGLTFLAVLAVAIFGLSWAGEAGFVATIVMIAGAAAFVVFGLAVVSVEMGRRIHRLMGREDVSDLRAFWAGGPAILLSSGIPILGWVMLVHFVCTGLGAVVWLLADSMPRAFRKRGCTGR